MACTMFHPLCYFYISVTLPALHWLYEQLLLLVIRKKVNSLGLVNRSRTAQTVAEPFRPHSAACIVLLLVYIAKNNVCYSLLKYFL